MDPSEDLELKSTPPVKPFGNPALGDICLRLRVPKPVFPIEEKEFLSIQNNLVASGDDWALPETHVYVRGRNGDAKPTRKLARLRFRERRWQAAMLLFTLFRKPDIKESVSRLTRGCSDPFCVNPFHIQVNRTGHEKNRSVRNGARRHVEQPREAVSWAMQQHLAMAGIFAGESSSYENDSCASTPRWSSESPLCFLSMESQMSDSSDTERNER